MMWHRGTEISRTLLQSLGTSGVVGLGVLAFCAAFYGATLLPAQAQLARLQTLAARQQAAQAQQSSAAAAGTQAQQLAQFYAFCSEAGSLPDRLEDLYDAAHEQGILLPKADYRMSDTGVRNLARYQLTLAVQASYVQIRKFVAQALQQDPALVLDGVQFEREKVGDAWVNAKIRFSVLQMRAVPSSEQDTMPLESTSKGETK